MKNPPKKPVCSITIPVFRSSPRCSSSAGTASEPSLTSDRMASDSALGRCPKRMVWDSRRPSGRKAVPLTLPE
jgi:hypothetical protein